MKHVEDGEACRVPAFALMGTGTAAGVVGGTVLFALIAAAIAGGTGSSILPALYMVVVAAVATLALVRWLPEVGGRRLDAAAAVAVGP